LPAASRSSRAISSVTAISLPHCFCVRLFVVTETYDDSLFLSLYLANCYEGRYHQQIAPRDGDASPLFERTW
ncbi:MAG: hypothetical protein WBW14_29665, partial [Candidatus Acidiferrum sp.]